MTLVIARSGECCLERWGPLRLVIYGTPHRELQTSRAYDVPQLYRNVIAEGLPPCKV